MPRAQPPAEPVRASLRQIPAGALLWRVDHTRPAGRDGPVFSTGATAPDRVQGRWGGRFDCTRDAPFPFLYAALDDLTALCETLLRDVPFDGEERFLPRVRLRGRRVAVLTPRRPLRLVALTTTEELAAVQQDSWLVTTDWWDYPRTQSWGAWLRRCSVPGPDGSRPDGLLWPSVRNPGGRNVVLYGDRCGEDLGLAPYAPVALDGERGLDWLRLRLSVLRTRIPD